MRGQHIPSNDAVIADVKYCVTSLGADFYKYNMQVLVHHWVKCITNSGDYVEKIVFCSREFAVSNNVTVLFVPIVVSTEMNRRHYFQKKPCRVLHA